MKGNGAKNSFGYTPSAPPFSRSSQEVSQAHSAGLDVIIAEEHSQLSPTKILASANSRVLTKSLLDLLGSSARTTNKGGVCQRYRQRQKAGLAWPGCRVKLPQLVNAQLLAELVYSPIFLFLTFSSLPPPTLARAPSYKATAERTALRVCLVVPTFPTLFLHCHRSCPATKQPQNALH